MDIRPVSGRSSSGKQPELAGKIGRTGKTAVHGNVCHGSIGEGELACCQEQPSLTDICHGGAVQVPVKNTLAFSGTDTGNCRDIFYRDIFLQICIDPCQHLLETEFLDLGKLCGRKAAALYSLITNFAFGMNNGLALGVSRNFGAGDQAGVKKSVCWMTCMSCFWAVALTVVFLTFRKGLLQVM